MPVAILGKGCQHGMDIISQYEMGNTATGFDLSICDFALKIQV